MSADGSQTGSVLNATITNAGVVDVDISGNLSVAGTTTYVETTNLKISDAIIELNNTSNIDKFNNYVRIIGESDEQRQSYTN